MLYEELFFFVIVVFLISSDKINSLYLIVVLLPFNSFIKDVLEYLYGGGALFTYWKEAAIAIFAVKVFLNMQKKIDKQMTSYFIVLFFYIMIFFFIGYIRFQNLNASIAKLRDILFPILLFLSLCISKIKESQVRRILFLYTLSFLLIGLTGFMDLFGGYRLAFALITQKIKYISNGILYYPDAMEIMGYNRMNGIMDGPNQLGLYTSVFVLAMLVLRKKIKWNNIKDKLIDIIIIMSIVILILTFSRTAIVTVIIAWYIYLRNEKGRKLFEIVKVIFIILAIYFILTPFLPQIHKIFLGTISGHENSSANRGNDIFDGLKYVLNHPLGNGLGASYLIAAGQPLVYFVESAFLNICIELGIMGLILLIGFYILILIKLKNKISSNSFAKVSYALLFTTIITSFFSTNPAEPTYTFYLWMFLGLSFSIIISDHKRYNFS